MFQNMNPLDRNTAILEIGIMLLVAVLIGFVTAWLIQQARRNAAAQRKDGPLQKAQAQIAQLQQAIARQNSVTTEQKAEIGRLQKAAGAAQRLPELEKKLKQAETDRASLRQQVRKFQADLAAQSQAPATSPVPTAQVDQLQQEIATLTRQQKTLQHQLAKAEAAKEDTARLDRLQKELATQRTENKRLRGQLDQQSPANAELASLQTQLASEKSQAESLGQQLRTAQAALKQAEEAAGQLPDLRQRLKQTEAAHLAAQAQISRDAAKTDAARKAQAQAAADLKAQLEAAEQTRAALETEVEKLRATAATTPAPTMTADEEMAWLRREREDQEAEISELETRILQLEKDNASWRSRARAKVDTTQTDLLRQVTAERDALLAQVATLTAAPAEVPEMAATEEAPALNFAHLGKNKRGRKSDLSRIHGIGPVIEQKLNALGIQTFKQVSRLTEADMSQIDAALALFPGRVKREKWVKQAKKLMKEGG